MSIIVVRGTVFDGENHYNKDDVINGLSQEDEKSLIVDGIASLVSEHVLLDEVSESISLDEFAKLQAVEQKERLEKQGIEPASNVEGRVEQYTAWLDKNNALV